MIDFDSTFVARLYDEEFAGNGETKFEDIPNEKKVHIYEYILDHTSNYDKQLVYGGSGRQAQFELTMRIAVREAVAWY